MIPFSYDKYKAGVPVIRRDGGTPPITVIPTPAGETGRKFVAVYASGCSYPHNANGFYIGGSNPHNGDIGHPDPTPKYRPWTPDEAIGQRVRLKGGGNHLHIIVSTTDLHVGFSGNCVTFQALLDSCETLNGKPCGVEVGE